MGREYKFYCVVCRESFVTDEYKKRTVNVRGGKKQFAVAKHICGRECWRIIG